MESTDVDNFLDLRCLHEKNSSCLRSRERRGQAISPRILIDLFGRMVFKYPFTHLNDAREHRFAETYTLAANVGSVEMYNKMECSGSRPQYHSHFPKAYEFLTRSCHIAHHVIAPGLFKTTAFVILDTQCSKILHFAFAPLHSFETGIYQKYNL